ncbi:FkbM family methyltransferase [Candidatus Roizmanbacteria bacterium]|nr:FkbM family methyltransferase [Candidatus Roizmanbacteria bacterium]
MNSGERFPRNFVELAEKNIATKPRDVAWIMINRFLGHVQQQTATLRDGQQMEVMIPEGISNFLSLEGDFEPEVTCALQFTLKPDMVFWNIGSHIGLRVVQSDRLVGVKGVIFAFEPTPRTKELLDLNSQGRKSAIQTFPYALGNQSGTVPFTDYGWLYSGCNTAAHSPRIRPRPFRRVPTPRQLSVPMKTVDALINDSTLRTPDVIAVDAEGYEFQIFQGADTTFTEHRPIVIFETGDIGSSQTIPSLELLQQHGYKLFEWDSIAERLCKHELQKSYPESGNLVAIHPQAARDSL